MKLTIAANTMLQDENAINNAREYVNADYNAAVKKHRFLNSHIHVTEYIYCNQKEDALGIMNTFYTSNVRAVSVQKKTKVGADGLMIELVKLMTTHSDDNFIINPNNIRILTGMSNKGWEDDMKAKVPNCFVDKIFHHGKLSKSDLSNFNNALIIIDEIDSGDKETQKLHSTLKDAGVLDLEHMRNNNNRFVFISATMAKELYDLYQWGDLHKLSIMTIPSNYIGHFEFLKRGIIKEFYPMKNKEDAERWIQEDILDNYDDDFRVHIVRIVKNNVNTIQDACITKDIQFLNHTSDTRLSYDELKSVFEKRIEKHVVIAVKGFYRRANLIPNEWKKRIGAVHEYYTTKIDTNVQIQGLPGRMTGYWFDIIENGHKTGPYRTSIKAVKEYETSYNDPFGNNSYTTSGFVKRKGNITVNAPTFLSPHNIDNLEAVNLPIINDPWELITRTFDNIEDANKLLVAHKCRAKKTFERDENGFIKSSTTKTKKVLRLDDVLNEAGSWRNVSLFDVKPDGPKQYGRMIVAYENIDDKTTDRYIIRIIIKKEVS